MSTRTIAKKILKVVKWLLLSLGAIILLIIILLQVPAVQDRLTGMLENALSDQLKAEVRIGRIGLDFPKYLTIEDVYLGTPAGDSLFSLGKLGVDINMLRLFRKEVLIQKVKIEDVYANVITTDSSSNIQFLLDAFLTTDTSVAPKPEPQPQDSTIAWVVNFPHTTLDLKRADIYYQDDPTGILLDGKLGAFYLRADEIDLGQQLFRMDRAEIEQAVIYLAIREPTSPPDTSTADKGAIEITGKTLSISGTAFRMESEALDLDLDLPQAEMKDARLIIGNEVLFAATDLKIENGAYAMDLPAPAQPKGLDPNHLHLSEINFQGRSVYYHPDSISLDVDQLQAVDQSGLRLNELHGQLRYTPSQLEVQQLVLSTERSELDIPRLILQYDFQQEFDPQGPLQLEALSHGNIAIADLLYLIPQLDTINLLRNNVNQHLVVDLEVSGNQRQLEMNKIFVDGPGLRVRGSASAAHVLNMDSLSGNFQLTEFAALPKDIIPLLPDSLFPDYIDWPQQLQLQGDLRYFQDRADFRLRAQEQRDSTPVNTVLEVSGWASGFRQYPEITLDLTIDTLRATRFSALAYLPPNTIPEGYHLPDFLKGSGTLKGPLNDMTVDLRVATQSERTRVEITGQLENALKPDSLQFDLRVPVLVVDVPELQEILPDSTLPHDLNLPDLRISGGRISGNLTDIDFRLPLETINGEGVVEGHYAAEDFLMNAEISGFRPENLYTGARSDSLAMLALGPLSLTLETSGRLEPELDATLHLVVYEGTKGALLNLNATAHRDTFSGNMAFTHADLQGSASATYIQLDSLPEVSGKVEIKRADLERWRLSDRSLYMSGKTSFRVKGLDPEDLSARLQLDNILLRSDTSTAFVDSLSAYAEMHQGNNEIEVFSDLLNFTLEGSFRPTLVFGEITRFLEAYWREEVPQPDPVVYGNYLKAYLEIRNPRPLTSGIIPGLRAISPMTATFIYREREPELLISARLPHLNYAGIEMDSLVLDSEGSQGEINYRADWKNINLFDQVVLGRTRISGQNDEETMAVQLQVWDGSDSLIHHLQANIDPEPDSFLLQLAPEQVIDRTRWTIPADNRLLISGRQVSAQNWELSHQQQRIAINTPAVNTIALQISALQLASFSKLLRSKEEIIVGVMDGDVVVNNPLEEPRFNAQMDIRDLSVYSKLWGDLSLDLANESGQTYQVDLQLTKAANDLALTGAFVPDGALDLQLRIGALQLQSVEPLSLGYLSRAQGHLTGSVDIGGNFSRPSYQGQIRLVDAAMDVELLQTRFRIENEPIRFDGQTITVDNLSFYDPQNNEAVLEGTVTARTLSNYEFDLSARARDFLVLNTTSEDNELYYGYLRADADIEITGDIYQPALEITATPKENSHLTYSLVQNTVPQAESRSGVVRFVEKYEWRQTIVADSIRQLGTGESRGFSLTTNINVNPGLRFTVVIDPLTGDQFSGRGEGDIVFRQFADGKMEMTGRIEMVEGLYDFTYQGLISRQFTVEQGSSVSWQGDPMNPSLDLNITNYVQAVPYPLVNEFTGSAESNLRRQQTFAVRMYLDGTLEDMQVSTDILYPEDISGNTGLPAINQSLSSLRTDPSRLNTQAFGLLLFKGFVNFGDNGGQAASFDNSVQSGLDNVLSQQLNNLANRYISFVELDFGMESFNTSQGGRQRDLRLSLRKRLFNNRLIISVDGVTQTGETDENNTLPQTYLDNLTAEFLLTKNGGLRLKVFSDRELDQFTTGDVVRIGGRLAFSKDFNRFFWSSDKEPEKDQQKQLQEPEEAGRNGEQRMEVREE